MLINYNNRFWDNHNNLFGCISDKQFFGIIGNRNSNESFVLRYFLSKVWAARSKLLHNSDSKFWCTIDNASIHKSDTVKEYAKINKTCLAMIPAYSPFFNVVEFIIQALKVKTRNYRFMKSKDCLIL